MVWNKALDNGDWWSATTCLSSWTSNDIKTEIVEFRHLSRGPRAYGFLPGRLITTTDHLRTGDAVHYQVVPVSSTQRLLPLDWKLAGPSRSGQQLRRRKRPNETTREERSGADARSEAYRSETESRNIVMREQVGWKNRIGHQLDTRDVVVDTVRALVLAWTVGVVDAGHSIYGGSVTKINGRTQKSNIYYRDNMAD